MFYFHKWSWLVFEWYAQGLQPFIQSQTINCHNTVLTQYCEIWMNVQLSNFMLILAIDGWDISCKIAPRWMLLDLTNEKSILVQVMA